MIDLNKIEAAAKAASRFAWEACAYHVVSQDDILEMVSMIRERDAVLSQALFVIEAWEEDHDGGFWREGTEAIAAIKEVLK